MALIDPSLYSLHPCSCQVLLLFLMKRSPVSCFLFVLTLLPCFQFRFLSFYLRFLQYPSSWCPLRDILTLKHSASAKQRESWWGGGSLNIVLNVPHGLLCLCYSQCHCGWLGRILLVLFSPMPSTGSRRLGRTEELCCTQDNWSETLPLMICYCEGDTGHERWARSCSHSPVRTPHDPEG